MLAASPCSSRLNRPPPSPRHTRPPRAAHLTSPPLRGHGRRGSPAREPRRPTARAPRPLPAATPAPRVLAPGSPAADAARSRSPDALPAPTLTMSVHPGAPERTHDRARRRCSACCCSPPCARAPAPPAAASDPRWPCRGPPTRSLGPLCRWCRSSLWPPTPSADPSLSTWAGAQRPLARAPASPQRPPGPMTCGASALERFF